MNHKTVARAKIYVAASLLIATCQAGYAQDCSKMVDLVRTFMAPELCTIRDLDSDSADKLIASKGLPTTPRGLNSQPSPCMQEVADKRRREGLLYGADPARWCREIERTFRADALLLGLIDGPVRPKVVKSLGGGWTINSSPLDLQK